VVLLSVLRVGDEKHGKADGGGEGRVRLALEFLVRQPWDWREGCEEFLEGSGSVRLGRVRGGGSLAKGAL
jgi:hypothetical protein